MTNKDIIRKLFRILSISQVADRLSISRQHLYELMKDDYLLSKYKPRLVSLILEVQQELKEIKKDLL